MFSGGHSGGETPVPIPNTEVKPASADGTWGETPWESRTSPEYLAVRSPPPLAGGFVAPRTPVRWRPCPDRTRKIVAPVGRVLPAAEAARPVGPALRNPGRVAPPAGAAAARVVMHLAVRAGVGRRDLAVDTTLVRPGPGATVAGRAVPERAARSSRPNEVRAGAEHPRREGGSATTVRRAPGRAGAGRLVPARVTGSTDRRASGRSGADRAVPAPAIGSTDRRAWGRSGAGRAAPATAAPTRRPDEVRVVAERRQHGPGIATTGRLAPVRAAVARAAAGRAIGSTDRRAWGLSGARPDRIGEAQHDGGHRRAGVGAGSVLPRTPRRLARPGRGDRWPGRAPAS